MCKQLFTIILVLASMLPASLWAQTAGAAEAYAALSEDVTGSMTLTFYYDDQRIDRNGFGIGPFADDETKGWDSVIANIISVVFDNSFADYVDLTSTAHWFDGMENLMTITGISNLNTSNVTSMAAMFRNCSSLTSLDLSGLNTSNVWRVWSMFSGCTSMESINVSSWNTEKFSNMGRLFENCSALTTLDLSNFNTPQATAMSNMFYCDSSLVTIYASEGWNVEGVTESSDMFYNCINLKGGRGTTYSADHVKATYAHIDGGAEYPGYLTDINAPTSCPITIKVVGFGSVTAAGTTVVSGDEQNIDVMPGTSLIMAFTPSDGYRLGTVMVDTTNVTSQVIADSTGVSYYTLLSIYDAHNVTVTFVNDAPEAYAALNGDNTVLTFYYDKQKEERNGMDIGPFTQMSERGWQSNSTSITRVVFDESFADAPPVTSVDYWFFSMQQLTDIEGLQYLNTSEVTNMSWMFQHCSSLTALDLSPLNTQKVTNMMYMFAGCTSLTSVDLSNFNTGNVMNMSYMFQSCNSLTNLNLSSFNTQNVTDMTAMFSNCAGLTSLYLNTFDTQNVTNMSNMFTNCSSLTSLDLANFNTAKVTDMGNMFQGCSGLTSLDVSGFNTANVTGMERMFYACSRLTSLDVSGFNTANVTGMYLMFCNCSSLTSLDLSSFNTANVTNMEGMFYNCSTLTSLDLSSFNTANVKSMSYMFSDCSGLTAIYVGEGWSTAAVTVGTGMFNGCTALVGGRGTAYDANHTDHTYAHIDGGTQNPGYLTLYLTMGDANGDGDVNIADAVATVTNILGQTATDNFYSYAADMNGDGEIDIFDVTLIVNAVFNAASPAPAYSRAGGVAAEDVQLTAQGNRVMMGIEKEGQYTAFQFDVTLPEGTELEGVSLASASTNHQLSFQKRQGNTYRVIGLSMTNEQLAAANGRLVQLQLSDNAGEKNVKMSNVIFVGQPATDATAIRNYVSDGAADRDAIYDLNGRYVGTDKSRLTKGIYIINHKKVNIK